MRVNYLDLFSGCGGFRKGLEEAGFTFEWEGHSEIDKHAKKVYQKHFPNSEDLGDVRTVNPDKLPKIDVITFGFPCQDLSVAGKQAGLSGSRSGLFFEAMRIVRTARPRYFIFENVKGLFSSNEGRDWLTVLREVADTGYDGQWQLLNTRWFLPQNRERVYFVGHIRGEYRPQIFPIRETTQSHIKSQQVANCLDSNYHKGWLDNNQRSMVYSIETPTLPWTSREQNIQQEESLCLRTTKEHGIIINGSIRRFTPNECARLQGFPDNWHGDVSDTQAYRMYGNAVSVPVVKAVAERLL